MKNLFYLVLLPLLFACDGSGAEDILPEISEGEFTVSGSVVATADKYPCETSYIVTSVVSGVTVAVGNIGQTDDVVIINLLGEGNSWDNTTYTDNPDLDVLPNMLSTYVNESDSYSQDPDVRSSITFTQVKSSRVKGTFDINLVRNGGTEKINITGEFDDDPGS